jgi:hypothetical protein
MRKRNPIILDAQRCEGFSGDKQHFDVRRRARLSDLLDPKLVELSRGSLGWFIVSEDLA